MGTEDDVSGGTELEVEYHEDATVPDALAVPVNDDQRLKIYPIFCGLDIKVAHARLLLSLA